MILGADGEWREKADPMAYWAEVPPATSSRVYESTAPWGDDAWMTQRRERQPVAEPMSVYEVHLGVVAQAARQRADLGPADRRAGALRRTTSASPTSS